jgi:hypothetical protein
MEIKTFQELLALLKNAAMALLVVLAIGFVYVRADSIGDMIFELIDRMGSVEIQGVKITFGEKAFALNPDIEKLSPHDRREVIDKLGTLSPDEVDRLLHVTEYDSKQIGVLVGSKDIPDSNKNDIHCDYDKPTVHMRLFAAADQGLAEKSLVELTYGPELTETARRGIKDIETKAGKSSDIGYPSNCYTMILTKSGRDLKSMIVSELKRVFGPNMRAK